MSTRPTDGSRGPAKGSAKASSSSSSEDTRERLLAAAPKLFAQKGYDGTSVKELADAAGVNVSLISYHFGGKENLYRACLDQFGKERLEVAQRVLQPPKSSEEFRLRLQMFIEEMFHCHLEDPDRGCIIQREFDTENSIVFDIFRNTFVKVFEIFVGFIQSAQKAGLVRKELDPLLTANVIFSVVVNTTRNDRLGERIFGRSIRNPNYRQEVITNLIQSTLYGIAAPTDGTAPGPERSHT